MTIELRARYEITSPFTESTKVGIFKPDGLENGVRDDGGRRLILYKVKRRSL